MDQGTNNSHATNAIRQRMEEVRRNLDEGVQEIVEGARDLGDWRAYVKSYPWVGLGAAVAIGYLIVPRRRVGVQLDAQSLAELARQNRLLAMSNPAPKTTVRGILLPLVGSLVLRGVKAYFAQARTPLASPATRAHEDEQL